MKTISITKLYTIILVVFGFFALTSCATSDSPSEENSNSASVEATPTTDGNSAASETAAAPSDSAAPATASAGGANLLNNMAAPAVEKHDSPPAVPPTPEATSSMNKPVETPMEGGPVLRYLTRNTPILDSPADNGAKVGTLEKGDPITVEMQGKWAKLSDGMFIKAAFISKGSISRLRTHNPWRK